jgi:3-phosphoglycerate kinase
VLKKILIEAYFENFRSSWVPVNFVSDCIGKENAAGLQPGQVLLLENLRFIVKKKLEMLLLQNN